MKALLVPLACALVLGAAGCGNDDSTTTTPSASGALVDFERTGGVAGTPVRLTVEEDGSAVVEAGVDPARESFELGTEELDQLRADLEAADFDAVDPSTVTTGCNDCYVYEIAYGGRTTAYDESEEVPGSVTAAVIRLSDIAAAHYPPEADEPPIVN